MKLKDIEPLVQNTRYQVIVEKNDHKIFNTNDLDNLELRNITIKEDELGFYLALHVRA